MRKIVVLLVVILAVTFVVGCNDQRPSDLPQLYPCSIVITQEGKPLDGAVVNFVAMEATNAKYQASAITDADGKAVVATYGFAGVPAGRYKVCVWKTIVEGVTQRTNQDGELVVSGGSEYSTVEPEYAKSETTPLEIEVTGKKMPPTSLDVGKQVKSQRGGGA